MPKDRGKGGTTVEPGTWEEKHFFSLQGFVERSLNRGSAAVSITIGVATGNTAKTCSLDTDGNDDGVLILARSREQCKAVVTQQTKQKQRF